MKMAQQRRALGVQLAVTRELIASVGGDEDDPFSPAGHLKEFYLRKQVMAPVTADLSAVPTDAERAEVHAQIRSWITAHAKHSITCPDCTRAHDVIIDVVSTD